MTETETPRERIMPCCVVVPETERERERHHN